MYCSTIQSTFRTGYTTASVYPFILFGKNCRATIKGYIRCGRSLDWNALFYCPQINL